MTKHSLQSLLLLLVSAVMAGCSENSKVKTLGEREIYFDEKLASVSPDGDSACWIGSETGDIWYISDHQRRTYNIGTDHIRWCRTGGARGGRSIGSVYATLACRSGP